MRRNLRASEAGRLPAKSAKSVLQSENYYARLIPIFGTLRVYEVFTINLSFFLDAVYMAQSI
jgi:hypothetical protein